MSHRVGKRYLGHQVYLLPFNAGIQIKASPKYLSGLSMISSIEGEFITTLGKLLFPLGIFPTLLMKPAFHNL